MSALQSFLAASNAPASDFRQFFRLNIHKAPPFNPRQLPHISSWLVSEEKSSSSISSLNRPLSTESKDLIDREKRVLIGTYARAPVVLVRGKGCKVYDVDGMEYVDMAAGIAVNSLGYGDSDWVNALVEQANSLAHVSNMYYTEPQVLLAEHLIECSFADRVFFTNSGTEANEAAIKFARKFQRFSHDSNTHATEFVSFSNSFHGRTIGALALTSKENYRQPFEPLMPGVKFVKYGDIDGATKAIVSGKTAAVFVEPIQGEGGIHSAAKEFLQTLRSACDDAGALLIFDEVATPYRLSVLLYTACATGAELQVLQKDKIERDEEFVNLPMYYLPPQIMDLGHLIASQC